MAGAEVKVTVLAAKYNDNPLVACVLAVATDGENPADWEVKLSVTRNLATTQVEGEVLEDLIFERLDARLWLGEPSFEALARLWQGHAMSATA